MHPCRYLPALALLAACTGVATDRRDTVVFASGADLQSINPLLTSHPLARQTQRYVLLTTLVQRDSTMAIVPYLARRWEWSSDSCTITMHLFQTLRWSDGVATTARDVAWTLEAARDPVTGYPRFSDLASLDQLAAIDDSTVELRFRQPMPVIPDVLTDLAILPAHLFAGISHGGIRTAAWNENPVGNGPFHFLSHQRNRRWLFAATHDFPVDLGGPPLLERLVIAIVDEPTTKLAALTSGELDFAGIQPAHASFVRRDPHLVVMEYPLLFTYVMVFNTLRAPFDELAVRQAFVAALDRRAIVDGYLFGFGVPASGPAASDSAVGAATGADTTRARRLLNGLHPQAELLTVGSGEAALEQMVQGQLAAVGASISIRQLELATFLERVNGRAHDFDVAILGVAGDPDMGELAPLLRTAGLPPGATAAASRHLALDSAAVAFIYHARGVQGINRRVAGVTMDLRGEFASVRQWHIRP